MLLVSHKFTEQIPWTQPQWPPWYRAPMKEKEENEVYRKWLWAADDSCGERLDHPAECVRLWGGFDWQLPKLCRVGFKKQLITLLMHWSQTHHTHWASHSYFSYFLSGRLQSQLIAPVPPETDTCNMPRWFPIKKSSERSTYLTPSFSASNHAENIHFTFTKEQQCITATVKYFSNKLIWYVWHARWIYPSIVRSVLQL